VTVLHNFLAPPAQETGLIVMPSKNCHKCRTDWESGDKRQPGFKETCIQCNAYLHCCKNCKFHKPSMHNQCYIPGTEWVGDRCGANFCEEFEFAVTDPAAGEAMTTSEGVRKALDALFGEGETPEEKNRPSGFDDLFKC
jgi:hypothetical protein